MSTGDGWFMDVDAASIISLAKVDQLNPIDWQKLFKGFTSVKSVTKASPAQLRAVGLTEHQAACLCERETDVSDDLRLMKQHGIGLLTIDDQAYPSLLKEIDDPPLWLFYRCNTAVLKQTTLTAVGTRKPTSYALQAIEKLFPAELLRQLVTVSGLAYGVDKYIHQASLAAGGQTVAVLAGGLDSVYPSDHANLAAEIITRGGALISEYPPKSRPQPYRFPIRNRIVAGLSPLTIILEAKIVSGTLTTAKSALDYNRDIFALPGDINRPSAEGGNLLIQRGATLLDSPTQIAEYYGLSLGAQPALNLDTDEGQLLHLLTDRPLDLDEIVAGTGKPIENILGLVTQLELSGAIVQTGDGKYSPKK